jgi:hypothetical protein
VIPPLWADRVRKVTAGLLATALTVLLLRVLARAAGGRGSWTDPELFLVLALLAAGIVWVRAARRVGGGGPRAP